MLRAMTSSLRACAIAALGLALSFTIACGERAAPPPAAPAAPVAAAPAAWPGVAWDRAEVVVFNQVEYGPESSKYLLAYDPETGWNPTVKERKAITRAQAERAATLATELGGRSLEVSKCAFPRHAIVFFQGEAKADAVPVATLDVCFACGDVFMSPEVGAARPERNYETATDADLARWEQEDAKAMQRYDAAFPAWQAFFRDELGLAIDTFK